jgi:RHS repeat-associated protein
VLQFEKTGAGDSIAGDLSNRYLWGPVVDQLFADEQVDWSDSDADGEVLWALGDHLGSVRDVVDSNGDLRIHRVFDGFGNAVEETHYNASGVAVTAGQTGFVDLAFAFTGKLFDDATGLQNNLNRWYDGHTGRWMSEDPIGFTGGDANLYRYVANEPTIGVDPNGLFLEYVVSPIRSINELIRGRDLDKQIRERRQRDADREMAVNPGSGKGLGQLCDLQGDMRRDAAGDAKEFAEFGVQFNAMVLGGGFVKPGITIGPKIQRQMGPRGWTAGQIDEAVRGGQRIPAINKATGNPATRCVHPLTKQSVVIDNVTGEVIQVGGPGFEYGVGSGDLPLLPAPNYGPKR